MDPSRNYILDRIKSRTMTKDEFNFDRLQAPPLCMLLSPFDIQELHSIATSLKWSAKPQLRYQAIDNVMRRRGFIKFVAGTNRVAYRHPEDTRFLIKIACDDVGMRDNPAEYNNQFIFKPFVTKCFEVSPCGTVGVFERVNPITSREEFLSVAEDIFEVINEWFIGEYVVADFGSKFFMNWGIREGFGPVLLDYPYMYKLDGNKLYCKAPDPYSPTGKCDGVIDYDAGYNFLHCTKCGVVYKAKELEQKIKNHSIIAEKKGDFKMKIKVSGGSKNIQAKVVDTSTGGVSFMGNDEVPSIKVRTNRSTNAPMKETVKDRKPVEEKKTGSMPETRKIHKSVNGASSDKKVADSPVTFGEKVKSDIPAGSPVKDCEDSIKKISENLPKIEFKESKNMILDSIMKLILDNTDKNELVKIFESTAYQLRKEISPVATNEEILSDMISSLASKDIKPVEAAKAALGYVDDCLSNKDFGKDNSISVLRSKAMRSIMSSNLVIQFTNDAKVNGSDVIVGTDIKICIPDVERPFIARYEYKTFENLINVSDTSDTSDQGPEYNGYTFCEAQKLSIKELFPSEEDTNVIVLVDGDGNYAADKEGMIYAANVIDGKSIDAVELVSSDWLDGKSDNSEEFVNEESKDTNEANDDDNASEYSDNEADNAAEDSDNQGVMKEVRGDMFNDEAKETPVENLTQDFCDNLRKEMMGGK